MEGGTFPLPHLVSHVAQMPTEQIWSNIIIQKRGRHGPQKNSAHHLQRGQSQGAWPPGADPSTLGGEGGPRAPEGLPERAERERERECLQTEVWEQEEKKTVLSAGSQEEKISTRSQKSKRLNKREKKSIG